MAKVHVGIAGASSYTARELLARLISHPAAEPVAAMARVEQPTPVVEDGKELCKVYHYSGPISLQAKNVVLAVGNL